MNRATKRGRAQDRFTRAVTRWMLDKHGVRVAVVESMDRPDGLDVIRADGQDFTPAQAQGLAGWRLGYSIMGGRF